MIHFLLTANSGFKQLALLQLLIPIYRCFLADTLLFFVVFSKTTSQLTLKEMLF